MLIISFLLTINPFNEANFVSLPSRSISLFSNPAGIGITPGAELFSTYQPGVIKGGLVMGNFGIGISKIDTSIIYEIGAGLKLPGAFSLGYSRQFGDTTENFFGLICILNRYLVLGYRTNLGRRKIMDAGAGVKIAGEILTLTGEIIYEGIEDSQDYLFGFIINPYYGLKINFVSDQKWNWHTGIELGAPKLKLGAIYSKNAKKFTAGVKITAQDY